MLFKLRDVFLLEKEKANIEYFLDMSSFSLNGINPFIEPVKVSAEASNDLGLVKLKLLVSCVYSGFCDRCGKPLKREYEFKFSHVLVTSLNDDSDDEYIEVPGCELELDDLVISDIVLELPSKFLCKEDCKGLCPHCGKDLNQESCNCKVDRVDPRLEVLKHFFE